MDNPEKLATPGTQEEEKQTKTQHNTQTNSNNMIPPMNNWR